MQFFQRQKLWMIVTVFITISFSIQVNAAPPINTQTEVDSKVKVQDEPEPPIVVHMAGGMGGITPLNGIDWQVDMPWRMEPVEVSVEVMSPDAAKTKKCRQKAS